MMRGAGLLAACVWLVGCQVAPPPEDTDWSQWRVRVDGMDAVTLRHEREQAMQQYSADPANRNRLRAGYALSRPDVSLAQLEQSRHILAQISADSELAPYRDLLDKEIELRMRLQRSQLRMQELQLEVERLTAESGELELRIEGLLSRIRALETQLEALKSIEEEMVETQQKTDDMQP